MSSYFSKVLILGGNGFVGRAIGNSFKDYGVNVVSLSSSEVDLCDPSCVDFLKKNLGAELRPICWTDFLFN
jgi:dTDP-4-dehydrorhamnose reductase